MIVTLYKFLIHVVIHCKPVLFTVPVKHTVEGKAFQCGMICFAGSPVCGAVIKVLHCFIYLLATDEIAFYLFLCPLW